jgi:hypothetical protein
MKKFYLTAILAALGLALPAVAQVQANTGDLILGFRATGGTGQNVNLEVNLGSVSQFQGQAAGTTLSISRLSAADLAATYGAAWASRTDLYWGIVGTAGRAAAGPGGAPVATLWATNAETTVGTQSLAWTPGSRDAHFNASATIEGLIFGAPGSLNGATATSRSPSSATVNAGISGSYASQDGPLNPLTAQFTTSFGFFNPTINNTVKADSSGYAVSDLYEVRTSASASTYLGSFGLKADGTLTFSTSPTFFTAAAAGAPVIATQPVAQSVANGANVTFTVGATGAGTLSYQWLKDGAAITGATSSTLTVSSVTSANAGNYSVRVTNATGSITSTGIALTVGSVPNPGRLINLSVLTSIAGAGDTFTFGFVVGGAGTSGNKPMLMRAAGPSLAQLGVGGVLSDPTMEFYNGATKISQNDDWAGDTSVFATSAAVGAFPYTGATSKDSAIYVSAIPLGNDSVKVSGVGAAAGAVIAELYDATPTAQFGTTTPRLVNVSVLKSIGSSITVGFVIGGSTSVKVLVRAVGPTVGAAPFNVGGAIADPKLTLIAAGGATLGSNDDWGTPVGTGAATAAQLSAAFAAVGAFNLPAGSKDAALLVTLSPGNYTAQVTASTGTTGVGLVEVYEAP